MIFQFTEHPTPKFELLVDAPKFLKGNPSFGELNDWQNIVDKCERIEITNPKFIFSDKVWTERSEPFRDGDTFEIDDEKVSVEIRCHYQITTNNPCSTCENGCQTQIATLKLKEVDEDKILAEGVKKMIKEAQIKSEYVLKGSERNKTIDDVLEILYCYLGTQTEVTKEIIREVKKLKK